MAVFHQLAIDQPEGLDGALPLYLNALSPTGLAAWVFTQFIAPSLRSRTFVVEDIIRQGSVTELSLRPEGGPMRWKPGQFAFFSASQASTGEVHPLTIAATPNPTGNLRLGIKALGGWTRRLPGFTVHIVVSAEEGRLSAQKLTALAPFPPRQAELFYCGPKGVRDAIVSGLKALGESPRRVHHQAFELR